MTDEIEVLKEKFEAERKKRQKLENHVDELRERLMDVERDHQNYQERLVRVEETHENLAGIAEGEETAAKTRRRDLVLTLKRKAEANGGAYSLDYNHVKDDLAGHGHGLIDDRQAYRDMEWIAERVGGVTYPVSHPVSGNKAVSIDLDAFHGLPSEIADSSDGVSRNETGAARSDTNLTTEPTVNETD